MKLSPTSINTLFHCPRQLWYKYIEKLPDKPSIHLVKGIAVHHALELIFNSKITAKRPLSDQLEEKAKRHYMSRWKVDKLGLTKEEEEKHLKDGLLMMNRYIRQIADNVEILINVGKVRDVYHAFNLLKPKFKELRLKDDKLHVGGSIDQVNIDYDDNITLVDLKTSSKYKNNISTDYERQLAIYAYLYYKNYGTFPKWVCINYLRYGESFFIKVTDDTIEWAKAEIERARHFLHSRKLKEQYYRKYSKLCDYCSYNETCRADRKKEEEAKSFFNELKEDKSGDK